MRLLGRTPPNIHLQNILLTRFLLRKVGSPTVFAKLTPATLNWIYDNADWTQESSCAKSEPGNSLFTSCQCGLENKYGIPRILNNRFKIYETIELNIHIWMNMNNIKYYFPIVICRILGTNVRHAQYPWVVLIYNILRHVFYKGLL